MFLNIFGQILIDSFEDFLVDQDRQFQNTQIWGETVSDFLDIYSPLFAMVHFSQINGQKGTLKTLKGEPQFEIGKTS